MIGIGSTVTDKAQARSTIVDDASPLRLGATHKYFLSDTVYMCELRGVCVFLDTRADRYSSLDVEQSQRLKLILENGPDQPGQAGWSSESRSLADNLVARGILTTDPTRGRPWNPILDPFPHRCVQAISDNANVKGRDIAHFYRACIMATFRLKLVPFEKIISHFSKCQQAAKSHQRAASGREVSELTLVFGELRPFYWRNYLCLFDSIALLEFLGAYGFRPRWVFGVKHSPFYAHCWLQEGDLVLHDDIDIVRHFVPIMSI